MTPTKNTLFYGDNLDILRQYIASESVDLIYLDPPFNSNRSYNVLFKDESGKESEAQITAFDDTWHWNFATEQTFNHLVTAAPERVCSMMGALRGFIGENQMMAYLVMMAARLVELHRVLKPTGSLYLHCDPTASHYLKVVLDTVFGVENFRNEITWKRTSAHGNAKRNFGDVTDCIFYYSKTKNFIFNQSFVNYSEKYLQDFYRYVDEKGRRYRLDNLRNPADRPNLKYEYKGYKPHPNGWAITKEKMEQLDAEGRLYFPKNPNGRIQLKRYLDEMPGNPVTNLWDDLQPLGAQAAERLGYPTQKPLALLERIVQTSSNPDDLILDPFCGCGTTVAAAQKLGRRWLGVDITHLAITLQKYRLREMFPGIKFDVIGEPKDLGAANQLAIDDRYQFQWWALSLVEAKPLGGEQGSKKGKKGSDKGIDGVINFLEVKGKPQRVLVQVKSGKVKSGDIRDLRGTVEREKAAIGVFITLEPPTSDMIKESAAAGIYHPPGWNREYPKIQILTVADLLQGAEVKMPWAHGTFKQAQKVEATGLQHTMDLLGQAGEPE